MTVPQGKLCATDRDAPESLEFEECELLGQFIWLEIVENEGDLLCGMAVGGMPHRHVAHPVI